MKQNNQHKSRRPHRSSPAAKIIVFAVIILLIVIGVAAVINVFNYKPSLPSVGGDLPFDANPASPSGDSAADDAKPTVSTDSSGGYVRTNTDKYNFLVIGCDRVGLNTDVIMLCSFDTKTDEISVMQIPRDTYIELSGVSHKINAVYASLYTQAKRDGSDDPERDGMDSFVRVLQTNMNIKIDYWALCSLDGFVNIVDIIGGVDINVPFDMDYDDPYQDLYIHLKAGEQTLDGAQSEQFIRFRHDYVQGDVGRVNAQKIFLAALMAQLKKSLNITNIASVAGEFMKNVKTSLSASDIIYFAKEAIGADLSALTLLTLPGTDARANGDSGAWYYIMYRADSLAVINRYFNVYSSDITDAIFDKNLAFTDEARANINNKYRTEASEDLSSLITDGQTVMDDSIDIALVN
ncbi:MAG: LCP family protein [Eubacteriales bacterium]